MAAGYAHSIVLGHGGEVVSTFGYGHQGQLGHGHKANQLVPRVVGALEGVKVAGIAAGNVHTIVWTTAGAVYTFGWGDAGRLGHGGEEEELLPRDVQALEGRKVVCAAGAGHTVVRTDQDEIFTFGPGGGGRLGHGVRDNELVPRMVDFTPGREDNYEESETDRDSSDVELDEDDY